LQTGESSKVERPSANPFVSNTLLKRLDGKKSIDIQSAPNRNAIVLTENGEAYTWDEKLKKLSFCPGHMGKVKAIAMCSSDARFAASYSSEQYHADKNDGDRYKLLNNQKLVRVRIVKTGQCQWRLPTNGRTITKLQFFTSNRIILAGYATNGDILLWELINEIKYGRECGRWENVEIVHNNQSEPLECAFPDNKKDFISAYVDGTILIRPFSGKGERKIIETLPGIDAGVLRWNDLKCDDQLKQMLNGYQHQW
jgi:WD40 repeat protein